MKMIELLKSFIFISLSIYLKSTFATEYKGEGCKQVQLINTDGTCPGVGLFAVAGDCTLYENCTIGSINPHTEFCYPGSIFNGNECVATNNTILCPQTDCVLIKDGESHELDFNSLEEGKVHAEKNDIVNQIHSRFWNVSRDKNEIIDSAKTQITTKGKSSDQHSDGRKINPKMTALTSPFNDTSMANSTAVIINGNILKLITTMEQIQNSAGFNNNMGSTNNSEALKAIIPPVGDNNGTKNGRWDDVVMDKILNSLELTATQRNNTGTSQFQFSSAVLVFYILTAIL